MSTEATVKVSSLKAWLHALLQDQTSVRIIRFSVGVTLSAALAYGINWPLSFLLPILVSFMLSLPLPMPSLQAGLRNMLHTLMAFGLGLAFSLFFMRFPIVDLVMLGLVATAALAETKPVVAIIGTGDMGDSLGPRLADLGYTVVYGSRDPEGDKAQGVLGLTGPNASVTTQREAAQAHGGGCHFGATGNHHIHIAVLDHSRSVADVVGTGRAGGDDAVIGSFYSVLNRQISRNHVDDIAGHKKRRNSPGPSLQKLIVTFLDTRKSANSGS